MDTGTVVGGIGILATAAFSIWASIDTRRQVRRLIRTQRDLAWVRVQNDLVWLFVDPTGKGHSKEIARGMGEYAVLAKELDPEATPDDLRKAANNEALEMAVMLVADGYGEWKEDLDMAKLREALAKYKAEKDDVRAQGKSRRIWARLRDRLLRR
jgi:hypothetical protein